MPKSEFYHDVVQICFVFHREKFTIEVESNDTVSMSSMPCTKQLVEGIMTRLDLLLHVNISPADTSSLTRTISQNMADSKTGKIFNDPVA